MSAKLERCKCDSGGHPDHAEGVECSRVWGRFGAIWKCASRRHAHAGPLVFTTILEAKLPWSDRCEWCSCPATNAPYAEPEVQAVTTATGGYGPDPLQEALRLELQEQEKRERA